MIKRKIPVKLKFPEFAFIINGNLSVPISVFTIRVHQCTPYQCPLVEKNIRVHQCLYYQCLSVEKNISGEKVLFLNDFRSRFCKIITTFVMAIKIMTITIIRVMKF
jgi:hypothetical protein